ncbi:hypothetical protein CN227_31945 [Sinorhizobium meliloti]|uniref:hypothetical protein n=1 Tax=Rhizobium meliloti TaxID=382 RepID=UPI000FD89346|nr:hypothetical protein [Sinorhizobium meliloti]MDW9813354.1 hypothetical protein [Sinorhizobium meliloti]RVE77003.1 hypothetical protein CN240_32380 [Sinorhizobium meliloti]RVG40321.1 hypothetical protein CN227_31945 [Sinorhizobium meliloti]
MADSDNSRTLSTVTRGDFYSFAAASLPTSQELARATRLPSDACNDDPALVVWQQWCNAREHLSESTLRQQRHESSLFSVVCPHRLSNKLHALGTKWQPSSTSEEEPWPQIRSVIADLLKIDTGSVASRLSMPERQPELQGD